MDKKVIAVGHPRISHLMIEQFHTASGIVVGGEIFGRRLVTFGKPLEVFFGWLQSMPGASLQHDRSVLGLVGQNKDSIKMLATARPEHQLFTVNLSLGSLRAKDAPQKIAETCEKSGLSFRDIVFEITEPKHDYSDKQWAAIKGNFETLIRMGMRYVWDDFADGDVRPNQLGQPEGFVGIKIDKAVTQHIAREGPQSARLSNRFRTAIEACANDGQIIVLEGVSRRDVKILGRFFPRSCVLLMQGHGLG